MSELDEIREQAKRTNAHVYCPNCDFSESFVDYLLREDRVSEEDGEITFGCPSCGHDTVDLGKPRETKPEAYVVSGIEEMEELAGE